MDCNTQLIIWPQRVSHHALQHTATYCNTPMHCNTQLVFVAAIVSATHCNTLRHPATHCNTLLHTPTHRNALQLTATHYHTPMHYNIHLIFLNALVSVTHNNSPQLTAAHCSKLKHTNALQHTIDFRGLYVLCNTHQHPVNTARWALQHTPTLCKTPQHTATHRNTPQHTNALQCTAETVACMVSATHNNTPQHTAEHCDTLMHCNRQLVSAAYMGSATQYAMQRNTLPHSAPLQHTV